ncbi:hypothetical protein IE53DRAFT_390452 [Violaceomyces palustris]|uniref:Uncharacterized protein n=1 Tax=Violaceomyces palustris TaxID=1673888 RepID=A0ACD0NNS4_9BASI|nr:hypothetical protein IE53DRAFT_390452 [Violaceomyces palustris]
MSERGHLLTLPSEVLELILSFLDPIDLISFSVTCKRAHDQVMSKDRVGNQLLWLTIFNNLWDPIDHDPTLHHDPPCSHHQNDPKGKAKESQHHHSLHPHAIRSNLNFMQETLKRSKALHNLLSLNGQDQDFNQNTLMTSRQLSSYNQTLEGLLSIATSIAAVKPSNPTRCVRDEQESDDSDQENDVLDLDKPENEARSRKRLKSQSGHSSRAHSAMDPSPNVEFLDGIFGDDYRGQLRWSEWIFPREKVKVLHDWLVHLKHEQACNPPWKHSDGAVSSTNQGAEHHPAKGQESSIDAKGKQRNRRRSSRLNKSDVPIKLRDIISDSEQQVLEKFPLPDQQEAARLHCLHGFKRPRYSREKKTYKVKSGKVVESLGFTGSLATDFGSKLRPESDKLQRCLARERVYDCARFGYENSWGPFKSYRKMQGGQRTRAEVESHFSLEDLDQDSDDEDDDDEDWQAPQSEGEGFTARLLSSIPSGMSSDSEDTGAQSEAGADGTRDSRMEGEADEDLDTEEEDQIVIEEADEEDGEEDEDGPDNDYNEESFINLIWEYSGSLARKQIEEIEARLEEKGEKSSDGVRIFHSLTRKRRRSERRSERIEASSDASEGASAEAEQALKVWKYSSKIVDWEMVESIMVCMDSNLVQAWSDEWLGQELNLPGRKFKKGFDPDSGWDMSRGYKFPERSLQDDPSLDDRSDPLFTKRPDEVGEKDGDQDKPFDWAFVESFWCGTYAFLDYPDFIDYNIKKANKSQTEWIHRALELDHDDLNHHESSIFRAGSVKRPSRSWKEPLPMLLNQPEAVGDLLLLRLELLPLSEQKPTSEQDAEEEMLEAEEILRDPRYPTLRFRGHTYSKGDSEPRGRTHGKVRPVFSTSESAPGGLKEIVGLHWTITHNYEGLDRWRLQGVQPGKPGTSCPIYGIWTDCESHQGSPNGPWIYWRKDDRKWSEIERIQRSGRDT